MDCNRINSINDINDQENTFCIVDSRDHKVSN